MEDLDEAKKLVNELLGCTTPGTIQHGMAAGQLGAITADKFKQSGELQDLDEAIRHLKTGLGVLPAAQETRVALLRHMVELYDARYNRMKDTSDLEGLIRFSTLLINAIPPHNSARGPYLLGHLKHLQEKAFVTNSGPVVQSTIELVQGLLQAMPRNYAQKRECNGVAASLFGKRYEISGESKDLDSFVRYVEQTPSEHGISADQEA
jgi:hypothetical protein